MPVKNMSFYQERKITIKDVARAAGVSAQTVSRVINKRPDVAPNTRRRVLEIINELGYRPNMLARSLSQQRSYSLGVVTAGLKYVGPSRTINGITAQAEALGYMLVLKELRHFDFNDIDSVLDDLLSRQVDGILWAVAEVGDNREGLAHRLPALKTPVLFLTMEQRPGWPVVKIDNLAGGRIATEHLLKLGHERIGHITGPLTWWEARMRRQGWADAMGNAGQEASDDHWVEGDWSSASGKAGVEQLLRKFPEMTGLFVGNDQMALGVLYYAHKNGIRIPEDLSIVGFDDVSESSFYWPALTTVHHDHYTLGTTAVQELVTMIDRRRRAELLWESAPAEDDQPLLISIEPTLTIRASTAPSNG
jgi:LacI family transcriptional regulator